MTITKPRRLCVYAILTYTRSLTVMEHSFSTDIFKKVTTTVLIAVIKNNNFYLRFKRKFTFFRDVFMGDDTHTHTHTHTHTYIYIYIYISSSCHAASSDIPDFSLSFIASGRSSGLLPVSSHSCCMYVRAGCPAFARPYVEAHRSTSLMSSSLLLQQCPACLVRLTLIAFMMGGR